MIHSSSFLRHWAPAAALSALLAWVPCSLQAADDGPQPPAPQPAAGADVPPTLPADVPVGSARLHLKSGTTTVEKLMLHDGVWYGQQNGNRVDFPRAEVEQVESNMPAEAKLKAGADALKTDTAVIDNTRFEFALPAGTRVTGAADQLAGYYPADRETIYPQLFGKYVAPWGKVYAQRPFYLSANLGYIYTKSVNENQIFAAHLKFGSDIELWRFAFEGDAHYGATDGIVTVNDQSASLKVDRYLASWLYAYAKSGLLHDDIAEIRYRSTQGAGIGLGTFDLKGWLGESVKSIYKRHDFDFEAGAEHLNEKDRNAYKEGWFARFAAIDKMTFLKDIEFNNSIEYLPALSNNLQADKGQYFINYRSEFKMILAPYLSLRLAYNLDYNSKPPQGSPNATHVFSASLGYSIG